MARVGTKVSKGLLAGLFGYPGMAATSVDNDRYWEDRRGATGRVLNRFQKERADWILKRVADGASILDLGSGDGAMLVYMARRKPLDITASDLSEVSLAYLRQAGLTALRLDLARLDAALNGRRFDHVQLCEVLEHLPDPERVLAELHGVATRSILFSVPNTGYVRHRLRLLFGRFPLQWVSHPGEHLRFWTLRDMRWWLDSLGYAGRYSLVAYRGPALLRRLWPALFARGLLVELRVDGAGA